MVVVFPLSKIVIKQNWSWGSSAEDKGVKILQGRCLIKKVLDLQRLSGNCPSVRGSSAPRRLPEEFVLCPALPVPSSPGDCWRPLCRMGASLPQRSCSLQGISSLEKCGQHRTTLGEWPYKTELLTASTHFVLPVPTGPTFVAHNTLNQKSVDLD